MFAQAILEKLGQTSKNSKRVETLLSCSMWHTQSSHLSGIEFFEISGISNIWSGEEQGSTETGPTTERLGLCT